MKQSDVLEKGQIRRDRVDYFVYIILLCLLVFHLTTTSIEVI